MVAVAMATMSQIIIRNNRNITKLQHKLALEGSFQSVLTVSVKHLCHKALFYMQASKQSHTAVIYTLFVKLIRKTTEKCKYTVSQKKTKHQTLAHNFPKC